MKKIGITEVALRDAHQSLLATRMSTEDMVAIAKIMDSAGYWSIECWGGATFDSCIRYLNEDPWERLRSLRAAMPKTRLQMLLRGQNLLGYRHYADDVVDAFIERASATGIDVFRIFDALNDLRNLERSIVAVKNNNKHAQGTISYTVSPVHTVRAFVEMGNSLEKMGCDSLCIKDMAGLITPTKATELVSELKSTIKIPISLHSHATSGMATVSLFKAIEAGCDMIDTSISSLSLGTSHPPTETIVALLTGTNFETGLSLHALDQIAKHFKSVRSKLSEFESTFTAADTRILTSQIPGGMLSNLESQLKQQKALDKLDDVMNEIPKVRKELGYPPLVTPTSQIVGTQAVLNVLNNERYKTITAETKALLGGHYGKTPAPVDSEIQKKALGDEKPITCRPADLLKPEMEKLKKEIGSKAKTLEDVLIYALFPKVAMSFFESRGKKKDAVQTSTHGSLQQTTFRPQTDKPTASTYSITVDGVRYNVLVEEGEIRELRDPESALMTHIETVGVSKEENVTVIEAPLAGLVLRFVKKIGDKIQSGETVLIIEAMKMETEIKASSNGTLNRYFVSENSQIDHGQPLYSIKL